MFKNLHTGEFLKKNKKQVKRVVLLLVLLFLVWTIWGNVTIGVTEVTIKSENIPYGFDGFKIVQISDLHNSKMAARNDYLYNIVLEEEPDIIVITGDLVDHRHLDIQTAIDVISKLVTIAPCYMVTGNHDYWLTNEELKEEILSVSLLGVTVLRNDVTYIEYNNEKITLVGLDDPEFLTDLWIPDVDVIDLELDELNLNEEYTLVLSHRPDAFPYYVEHNLDLVLTGHAHGGQVRLPLIGGVLVPDQGLFPKYDAGMYTEGRTSMYISRGIGNSVIPIRINNRPEVVALTLRSDNKDE